MITVIETSNNSWSFEFIFSDGADEKFDAALESFGAGKLIEAEAELKAILFLCPDHIDALHHLALIYSYTDRMFESYLCSREAVRLGLEALPVRFSWLTSVLNWGSLSNRPFMLAYHALALRLLERDGPSAALEPLARLVSVNHNDNLGARYMLMQCYLSTEAYQSAVALALQYPDDAGPDITYSKAVALLHLGDHQGATESLLLALKYKPNVAVEILRAKHVRPKSEHPGYITAGGADEAFDYWERNGAHWNRNSSAFKLLKQLFKK